MKCVIILLCCLVLTGCGRHVTDKIVEQEAFYKCLDRLPKGPTTTVYNDWDEVLQQCRWFASGVATSYVRHETTGW